MKILILVHATSMMTVLLATAGCASGPPPQAPVDTTGGTPVVPPATPATDGAGAKEGQSCGDGVFGRPNISCAPGLVCKNPPSTAPVGPSGSSSALPGTCRKP